ncbi:hypothetical protein ACFU6R_01650 [Streptomyces sp. NPDC057499]|uniref:hypothetical protein n=1 Tax=Streptomyces sp. NPDC057499 TaxID=3346150 RepID=UPI0036B8C57F
MDRTTALRRLATTATGAAPQRAAELAVELGIPAADLLVVAGHPVPAELLPPGRDAEVMRRFAYAASHCDHARLAELRSFVVSLPRTAAAEPFVRPTWPGYRPAETRIAAVLRDLLRNRGFGLRELPFLGLSFSTLLGMVRRFDPSPYRWQQLSALAGPLGWRLPDLFEVAGEPCPPDIRPMVHCHHLGRVFEAAVPLSTAQLVEAAAEADRLSAREEHGAWQPVSQGFAEECPDLR